MVANILFLMCLELIFSMRMYYFLLVVWNCITTSFKIIILILHIF